MKYLGQYLIHSVCLRKNEKTREGGREKHKGGKEQKKKKES